MSQDNYCGFDFGTSNSTIGIIKEQKTYMVPLEAGKVTLRSAIFFDYETGQCQFGQQGIDDYLSGIHGRLMMSLKSVLSSSLMQEDTLIDNKRVPFTDILGCLIRYIKTKAEQALGHELSHVVMGRPVHFHDDDQKRDQFAQDTLEKVAKQQGFKTVLFQYEPIAAALAYEESLQKEELALIVDLGGGTSDFTVIRLGTGKNTSDRREDVLANDGIHIGGTDFDTQFNLEVVMPEFGFGGEMQGINGKIPIPSSPYYDLTTWHTLNSLYTPQSKRSIQSIRNLALQKKPLERLLQVVEKQQGHKILNEVELGKCYLSHHESVALDLQFIESTFVLPTTRTLFQEIIYSKVQDLTTTLLNTVKNAGVRCETIDSIFFTGGSTQIPMIKHTIMNNFKAAKMVSGDVFSSVGKGLIIDAKRKFSA